MTSTAPAPTPIPDKPLPFPIALGRSWPLLLGFGVRPSASEVLIEGGQIIVRFGFFGARIAITDIERWDITGPYHWIRAVGVRSTFGKPDVSFCGGSRGAVRLWLKAKQHIAWVSADQVYLGVADLDGFAADLTRRGIPGKDLRSR